MNNRPRQWSHLNPRNRKKSNEIMPGLSFLTKVVPALVVEDLLSRRDVINREISNEHNTTTFLPVPIDLFSPFLKGKV